MSILRVQRQPIAHDDGDVMSLSERTGYFMWAPLRLEHAGPSEASLLDLPPWRRADGQTLYNGIQSCGRRCKSPYKAAFCIELLRRLRKGSVGAVRSNIAREYL